MELLHLAILDNAALRHPQAAQWLATWAQTARQATWSDILDVRLIYPSADGVPIGKGSDKIVVTIFNVGGNDFRLLTRISYQLQLISIEAVLTHAEYTKGHWKKKFGG